MWFKGQNRFKMEYFGYILKENSLDKEIKILEFVRYKVGEGV